LISLETGGSPPVTKRTTRIVVRESAGASGVSTAPFTAVSLLTKQYPSLAADSLNIAPTNLRI
jgi:hypothetical protein